MPSEGYFNAADGAQQQDNMVVEEFAYGMEAPVTPFIPQQDSDQV